MSGYSDQFASDLNRLLGVPDSPSSHTFYAAWAQAEGGHASYNPFNTTQSATGASNYNQVGVKNYTSYTQGVQATAQTLENGRYQAILAALAPGTETPMQLAQAEATTPWGTGAGIERVLGTPAVPGGSAQTVGFPNPLNIPGDIAGGVGSLFGGLTNIPGDIAGAVTGPIIDGFKAIISAIISPLEKWLEDAALILLGFILVIVGLFMMVKAAGGSGGAPAAPEEDEGAPSPSESSAPFVDRSSSVSKRAVAQRKSILADGAVAG